MKTLNAVFALGALAIVSAPAHAVQQDEPDAEVVERNEQGQATKVSIDGTVYDVCMTEEQDDCINPRDAGLNFGDVPLDYWPGEPASEAEETPEEA